MGNTEEITYHLIVITSSLIGAECSFSVRALAAFGSKSKRFFDAKLDGKQNNPSHYYSIVLNVNDILSDWCKTVKLIFPLFGKSAEIAAHPASPDSANEPRAASHG